MKSTPNINKCKLFIALGNPSPEYTGTFHNAGFIALDFLFGSSEENLKEDKNFLYFKKGEIAFAKTSCFMNQSGAAVKNALKFFKVKPEETAVLHDDSDISLGAIKASFGRNSAGHKGVESVIKTLKNKNFWRLRVGIRRPAEKSKAGDFVLKKISRDDLLKIHSGLTSLKESLNL